MDLKSDRRRVQTATLLYLLAWIALNACAWGWFVAHRHTPGHSFPLGDRMQRFGDLVLFSARHQIGTDPRLPNYNGLNGTLFPRNYPPLAVVVYLFLLQVCAPYAVVVFLAVFWGAIAVACALLWRRVRRLEGYRWYVGAAIFATGFLGWGTEQVVMRGNIEGWMWIAMCLGAALYARRRFRGAAAAFGVACCFKPYPILWLALMARQRRYREAALGIATAAVVSLGSLLAIDRNPLRAYRSISGRSEFFADWIVAFRPMSEMEGDHSLLQTMKTIARVVRNHGLHFPAKEYMVQANDPLAWKLYHACLAATMLLGLAVAWAVWNKPVLNQMFAVACVMTLFPLVAGDYTLTVLLIPMGFFLIFLLEDVATGRAKMSLGKMLWILLPCAWIMATEPLWVLHGVLKCAALLVLLAGSVWIPMPSSLFAQEVPLAGADEQPMIVPL